MFISCATTSFLNYTLCIYLFIYLSIYLFASGHKWSTCCIIKEENALRVRYVILRSRVGVPSDRKFEGGSRFRGFRQTKLVLGTFERRHVVVNVDNSDLQADNLQV